MAKVHNEVQGKPPLTPARGVAAEQAARKHRAEQLSYSPNQRSSGSGTSVRSKPRSVIVGGIPLSRDLSDLSGSYQNHEWTNESWGQPIPGHISKDGDDMSSLSSLQKSWWQAYILSKPSPDTILEDLVDIKTNGVEDPFVGQGGSFQAGCDNAREPFFDSSEASCIPLIVLFMDTNKRAYELVRIHIDRDQDSVRDVLASLRDQIPGQWKQDYDGLFQMRSGKANQLINCLTVQHCDVQPYECWFAKPWSMNPKLAKYNGEFLIEHLISIGVLMDVKSSYSVDSVIKLSGAAVARIYEPEGSLSGYHTKQYLSFSPPFEKFMPELNNASSVRSKSSSSRGSMRMDPRLQSLQEVDEDPALVNDESLEVETVSSYSHLVSVDPFPQDIRSNAAQPKKWSDFGGFRHTQPAVEEPVPPPACTRGFRSLLKKRRSKAPPLSAAQTENTWDLTPMGGALSYSYSTSNDSSGDNGSGGRGMFGNKNRETVCLM